VLGNAGSFFKNPVVSLQTSLALQQRFPNLVAYPQQNDPNHVKLAAGWLIDQAGWKGQGNEKVGVHDRQALVLVNRGGATAADIQDLATQIRNDIYAKFGVWLEQEPVNVA
jgi:UDP-N-acetylmuramate dehydrogenase